MAVSLKDIASRVGVSDVAVSLALRDNPRISLARRRQIQQLAREVGYRADPLARAMRTRKSQTIGLLISNLRTGVTNLKAEAVEQQMVECGHQVLIGFTRNEAPRLMDYVDNMVARRVDGLIIYGMYGGLATWLELRQRYGQSLPACVLVDTHGQCGDWPSVNVDLADGMAQLADHLLGLGHRDILHVGHFSAIDLPNIAKWKGFRQGVESSSAATQVRLRFLSLFHESWLTPQQVELTVDPPQPPNSFSPARLVMLAYEAGRRIAAAADRPTAIAASNDLLASALVSGLTDAGLSVPRDISVTGFDGDEMTRLVFRPRLTTVRQPQEQLADQVVQMLLALMEGREPSDRAVLVRPQLVLGESTAPPAVQ